MVFYGDNVDEVITSHYIRDFATMKFATLRFNSITCFWSSVTVSEV